MTLLTHTGKEDACRKFKIKLNNIELFNLYLIYKFKLILLLLLPIFFFTVIVSVIIAEYFK